MILKHNINLFLDSGAIISSDSKHVMIGYGQSENRKYEELEPDKPAFYFPDFFLSQNKPWLQFSRSECISIEVLKTMLLESGLQSDLKSGLAWNPPCKDQFNYQFNHLKSLFVQKILQKAVPYVFSFSDSSVSSGQLCSSLMKSLSYIQSYPCHLYGFWNNQEGVLGVTPELLFEYGNPENSESEESMHLSAHTSVLTTMALAGTSPKGECLNSFVRNPKELREHQLAIDGIKRSLHYLGPLSTGKITVLELPGLNHLMTPLSVVATRKIEFENVVRNLHPTPALGAFPREAGFDWLNAYDKHTRRDRFGAPAGILYARHTRGKVVVAIRNVQWNESGMKIGAGCGVIQESQCEREWNEIQLKLNAVKELLDL